MFDTRYFPMANLMLVTVRIAFNFVQADNTPPPAVLAGMRLLGLDTTRFFWTPAEQATYQSQFMSRVTARWSLQHTFRSTKPCWDFVANPIITPVPFVSTGPTDAAHYNVTVHKSSGPGIDYSSATNDPDTSHPERPATADLYQSDNTESPDFNSQNVATSERQRIDRAITSAAASPVLFTQDSDVVDPGPRGTLTALATALGQKNPSDPLIPLHLDGFASAEGDATHNHGLADRRGHAVEAVLTGAGVRQPITVINHGPVGAPNDAANRKVDISTDTAFETSYASNRYSVSEHEFGHMLGLPDEYQNNTTGVLGTEQTNYMALVTAAGVQGPAQWGDLTSSQMSAGVDVLPRHYVTLWEALGRMTTPDITQAEWRID
jgi:outer membrane protein OmpA-like peptidoglycan-associated protein